MRTIGSNVPGSALGGADGVERPLGAIPDDPDLMPQRAPDRREQVRVRRAVLRSVGSRLLDRCGVGRGHGHACTHRTSGGSEISGSCAVAALNVSGSRKTRSMSAYRVTT